MIARAVISKFLPPPPPRAPRRGSVVVVVLLTILFAGLLLFQLIESSSTELVLAMRSADRERLRADAHAALETTLAVLQDFRTVDGGLYSPAQGWSNPLEYATYVPREGVTIEVSFEDESGKLSLPRLSLDQTVLLLLQLGLLPNDATRVADALFAWTQRDHVPAESATAATSYLQADPPHLPPERSLRSFSELRAIAVARDFFFDENGRPTALWDGFVRNVSLYSFNSTNVNSASAEVLAAIGWDETQSEALAQHLSAPPSASGALPPFFRSAQEVQQVAGNAVMQNLGAEVRCLRVIVTARERAAVLRLSALVAPGNQARLPQSLAERQSQEAGAAAAPPATTPATAAPSAASNDAAATNTAGNTLQYPFTVLEIVESALPAPPANPPTAP